MFTVSRRRLMEGIAAIGARFCSYNLDGSPEGVRRWLSDDFRCDSKYGIATRASSDSELDGCPELKSAYRLLGAMNETEFRELRRTAGLVITEEDLFELEALTGLRGFLEAPANIQHDVLRLRPDLALRLKRVAKELGG